MTELGFKPCWSQAFSAGRLIIHLNKMNIFETGSGLKFLGWPCSYGSIRQAAAHKRAILFRSCFSYWNNLGTRNPLCESKCIWMGLLEMCKPRGVWGLATHYVLFFKGSGRGKTQNMFPHSNYPLCFQIHVYF